ncbi:hypothetical protein TNCV_1385471 [Trichonephila clavipes]|nr:hypothetical protein TNCV_1385471 [Trichonephila clavipes]
MTTPPALQFDDNDAASDDIVAICLRLAVITMWYQIKTRNTIATFFLLWRQVSATDVGPASGSHLEPVGDARPNP